MVLVNIGLFLIGIVAGMIMIHYFHHLPLVEKLEAEIEKLEAKVGIKHI